MRRQALVHTAMTDPDPAVAGAAAAELRTSLQAAMISPAVASRGPGA